MRLGKRAQLSAGCATVILAFGLGHATGRPEKEASILGVYGVGGVISESGTLWQYHPGEKRWMTIDEAFKIDKRETHILPLPVPAAQIRFMESFGFLVTKDGHVWQYDLEQNRWQDIGTP
jgi:hypothetical protein